ncbi:MAG TPA: penicillin acylase family protein, partial [Candidatus Limnocylindrales bacterium]|nr:penicillin acylase family protein [Candidatus Limnocylindrales bacterium]
MRRDAFGVPHIEAGSQDEAWFGMGFACAQDRIWQMDTDRRKGLGRFAEVAGPGALSADILARRLRLVDAAKRDLDILGGPARAMLEAYAAGVNAFLESGAPLAPEYGLTGTRPEAWQPWHSLVVFVIRHVLMGVWQLKVCQGILLSRVGEETFRSLDVRPPVDSLATVPPGRRIRQAYERAGAEIAEVAPLLGFLAETEAGSNAWVVHGSRTTTGRPVLCNDSHRRLDVPNVYWQAQLTCPAFTVAGAAFPGIPGFPHFGHNGSVAWAITHTHADTQDLYVEQFDRDDPTRYRTPEGFVPADRRQEWIEVRGGDPVVIDTWATRHGPVVHGDPRTGLALALR